MDTRVHGYYSHGTMPESGRTWPEWEAALEEYTTVIHGILEGLPAQVCDLVSVEYDAVIAQIMYWHREIRWLHPGEFEESELIQQALDSY